MITIQIIESQSLNPIHADVDAGMIREWNCHRFMYCVVNAIGNPTPWYGRHCRRPELQVKLPSIHVCAVNLIGNPTRLI